ncbi:PREDICTED: DNA polymerase subunit gamma-1-like [Priapulus caudatus]|uniref:DNA-directed DNA polymerase n=1 Tax=Priapulus caudatus TaxID=37621 RepID=A0ABM1EML6_PRICU|nr:PREDICTED: DNA polymerase subunit gamma-1-like [Priapulus caudatus]
MATLQCHKAECLITGRSFLCPTLIRMSARAMSKTADSNTSAKSKSPRLNPIKIQMLSEGLHRQVFGTSDQKSVEESMVRKSIDHLKSHDLWGRDTTILPEVDFKLPKLCGKDIAEHVSNVARRQSEPYLRACEDLVAAPLPPPPAEWAFRAGWTAYKPDGSATAIDYPEDDGLVFDIEVCGAGSIFPTLATAASPTGWYSWCSERLTGQSLQWAQHPSISDLIALETRPGRVKPDGDWRQRVVVGHNVSYDRARVKEQYLIGSTKMRFVDTMSFHIACSGLTSFQRTMLMSLRTGNQPKEVRERKLKMRGPPNLNWMKVGSMNGLADVYRLYCGKEPHSKETRNVFVKGTLDDVRADFQNLMTYCSNDVLITHELLQRLLPMFLERFPHPVTFAGMLEMGQAYLPVNKNWERYVADSDATYHDLQKEQKLSLMHLADDACELTNHERYKSDLWLWDLDWTVKDLRLNKSQTKTLKKTKKSQSVLDKEETEASQAECEKEMENAGSATNPEDIVDDDKEEWDALRQRVEPVIKTASRLPVVKSHLAGYPAWYRDLCPRNNKNVGEDWMPGPSLISSQVRVAPKLLRLTWDSYPVYYSDVHGWGYLVPGRTDNLLHASDEAVRLAESAMAQLSSINPQKQFAVADDGNDVLNKLLEQIEALSDDTSALSKMWQAFRKMERIAKKRRKLEETGGAPSSHKGNGPYNADVDVPGFWFFKLPHKDGESLRVGNPLAKDFLKWIEDGSLRAQSGTKANKALYLSKMTSYWKNAHKRITTQNPVWLKKSELPRVVTRAPAYDEMGLYGAIVPKVVTAGTLTRRAVEATWLTASNAYPDRVGSELKSMVQAPPGYHFVGADVDSQELWIAAILGDANFAGLHGCTAFGWMTLQGRKSEGTDLHSKTAAAAGVTRDQAKVLNYGRIYGAGRPFAQRLLMQFNHKLTAAEARETAERMYAVTKGTRAAAPHGPARWQHGSESEMFNKLEEIAQGALPCTPVLGGRISRALEPRAVERDFMTSRVNWVVQSSAVDYLHLTLVCVRHLLDEHGIDARFCISIHDEVRYLVSSADRYRAALALQVANLLTRAMFACSLGMHDLPQSVAFFSSVDVDTVLRKEVGMDCVTPSNPHGLHKGYGVPPGEALDIYAILAKTRGGKLK